MTQTIFFSNDFFNRRTTLHGFNAEGTLFAVSRFGFTGDLSFNRKKRSFDVTDGSDSEKTDVWYFMIGPSYVFDVTERLRPFGRILFGGAHTGFKSEQERRIANGNLTTKFDLGTTDFAIGIGGGLDVTVNDRFKLRVLQIDYAPIFLGDRSLVVLGQAGVLRNVALEGQRQDNLRFSFGIIF